MKEIIQISIELAKGCAYLEQSNIVHRYYKLHFLNIFQYQVYLIKIIKKKEI